MEGYSKKVQEILKKYKIEIGNRVKLTRGRLVLEGILMPRIELGDSDSLIIKLDNGYNTGIKFSENLKLEKSQEKMKLEQFPKVQLKFNPSLPSISMLATGGTISSRIDYKTGGVTFLMDPSEILFTAPELAEIVNIVDISSPFRLGSEDMTPNEWKKIADEAAKKLNKEELKGVVVTHGTDTLHFTSAALSFMLKNLNKPVAVVGAQRSPDRGSFDGTMNLLCAAHYAGYSDIAEVCIVMHGTTNDTYCLANRGTKVRKMHTSRRDAFQPVNDTPLAKIWADGKIEITNPNYRKLNSGKVEADTKFEDKVALIKVYPGIKPEVVDWHAEKMKGLIIEGTGLGHPPSFPLNPKDSLMPSIKAAIEKGVFVGMTSQCINGRVHPFVYNNARLLHQAGVVYLEDMLPEVAYVKLGWVLGHTKNLEEVKKMMLTNIAGEINPRHEPGGFCHES